mgnify:CR=1 FL=1
MDRRVRWFSCGVASAIATKLDLADHKDAAGVIAYCATGSEDEDNARFLADCEAWFGRPVERLRNPDFADTWAVWEKRRYMSGVAGAPCTSELKITPRLAFQRPGDVHVFGYTADQRDAERFEAFKSNYPELSVRAPLIERGITKAGCLALAMDAGLTPPRIYAMGFPNANCIPCVKATSPDYWALVRLRFPDQFDRAARLSRELGARLVILGREKGEDGKIRNIRGFIDEIPLDQPVTNPIAPACDFLCHIAGSEMAA